MIRLNHKKTSLIEDTKVELEARTYLTAKRYLPNTFPGRVAHLSLMQESLPSLKGQYQSIPDKNKSGHYLPVPRI